MRRRVRPWIRAKSISSLAAGLVVGAVAALGLTFAAHKPTAPVTPREAIHAALTTPSVQRILSGSHWNRAVAGPIDPTLEQVSFYAGPRIVGAVALERGRTPTQEDDYRRMKVPYGDWIAYEPGLLVLLCGLFVLMAGVTPWRRLRNLDVAATLSLVVGVVMFEHRYIESSVLAALPGMAYLMVRCVGRAFWPAGEARATPLLTALTPGLDPGRRVRWLRASMVVLALVYVMVSISSFLAIDVIYAVMEGATTLIHGVLPYGHMPPGIIHGDTYPILTYALYTPLALVAPVRSTWDSVSAGLAVAALAALAAAWGVFRMFAGARGRAGAPRPVEAEEAGLRAALAWLAFPPLLITASTGTTDVVLAAMLVFAVLLWRRPTACAGVLALAGWFKLAPFALLPTCLAPLRGRRLARAVGAIAVASLPSLALLIVLGGWQGPGEMIHAVSYQFSRASLQSVPGALGIPGFQLLMEASVLGLITAGAVRVRREPQLAADRGRMAALSGAILIGLQLSANYWAFLYLVWVIPLAGVALLADRSGVAEPVEAPASLRGSLEPAPAMAG